jgi:signal transduction histidine kinase
MDLISLVQRVAGRFETISPAHRIVVETTVDGLVGVWDEVRLMRVVENLLANAIKYSPDGGLVQIRVAQQPDWAVLEVQDDGIGIPEADLPRLFQAYRRAGNAAGHIGGAGLGLAGSQQIVVQHGGRIEVSSALGIGSIFTVLLPLGEGPTGPRGMPRGGRGHLPSPSGDSRRQGP